MQKGYCDPRSPWPVESQVVGLQVVESTPTADAPRADAPRSALSRVEQAGMSQRMPQPSIARTRQPPFDFWLLLDPSRIAVSSVGMMVGLHPRFGFVGSDATALHHLVSRELPQERQYYIRIWMILRRALRMRARSPCSPGLSSLADATLGMFGTVFFRFRRRLIFAAR